MLRRILAVALAAFGVVAVALAVASGTIWQPADHVTARVTAGAATDALIVEPGVMEAQGNAVTIDVTVPDGGSVLLAVGRDSDVAAWVGQSTTERVTGFVDAERFTVERSEGAEPLAADPAGSDLWITSRTITGQGQFAWTRTEGRWSLLIAPTASDGKQTSLSGLTVAMTWPAEVVTPYVWPGVAVGLVLIVAAAIIEIVDIRVRRRRALAEATQAALADPDHVGSVPASPQAGSAPPASASGALPSPGRPAQTASSAEASSSARTASASSAQASSSASSARPTATSPAAPSPPTKAGASASAQTGSASSSASASASPSAPGAPGHPLTRREIREAEAAAVAAALEAKAHRERRSGRPKEAAAPPTSASSAPPSSAQPSPTQAPSVPGAPSVPSSSGRGASSSRPALNQGESSQSASSPAGVPGAPAADDDATADRPELAGSAQRRPSLAGRFGRGKRTRSDVADGAEAQPDDQANPPAEGGAS